MIKAEYVNAFIEATHETFRSMCRLSFHRNGPLRKVNGEIVDTDELMAVLGLSGSVKGAAILTAPLPVGKLLVSRFLFDEIKEVDCDLMDGFGELLNILAGAADAKITDQKINLALPSVMVGIKTKFFAKAGNPFVIVPMLIENVGPFNIGISMEAK